MGRRRKPVEVMKKKGTYKKHRHEKFQGQLKVPVVENVPRPIMPLNQYGLYEYYRLCRELKELEILGDIDLSLVEMAANYYGTYVENFNYIINNYGSVSKYLVNKTNNTAMIYTSMNNAFKSYVDVGSRFGITPTARLNLPNKNDGGGEDEFSKFLNEVS